MTMNCEICQAEVAFNEHHLIPRHCHRKNWWRRNFTKEQMRQTIWVCKTCHLAVHDLIPDEKEIGRSYNSVEKLGAHPAFAKYLAWKRKRGNARSE